MKLQLRN